MKLGKSENLIECEIVLKRPLYYFYYLTVLVCLLMNRVKFGKHFKRAYTLYRVINKSVKHFKNSQQIDYATDHGNSYVDRERNC